ncbi:hypothetical protein VNO80_18445 [Phaseolus coccineus]|uniref:Uncharacterized protein n=1 Tax=Phaseolus coccineus TaxID=3886 RepID=A0AAN9R3W4_PHACN
MNQTLKVFGLMPKTRVSVRTILSVANSHKPQSKPIDIDGKWPKVSGLVLAGPFLSSFHHCTLPLSLSVSH